jgi:hypothetical protein
MFITRSKNRGEKTERKLDNNRANPRYWLHLRCALRFKSTSVSGTLRVYWTPKQNSSLTCLWLVQFQILLISLAEDLQWRIFLCKQSAGCLLIWAILSVYRLTYQLSSDTIPLRVKSVTVRKFFFFICIGNYCLWIQLSLMDWGGFSLAWIGCYVRAI